jgi:hypothetical protein
LGISFTSPYLKSPETLYSRQRILAGKNSFAGRAMKSNHKSILTILLIGPFLFSLACCSGTPRRYLASEASLINPGQTRADVLDTLGPPDISRENSAGEEELYYCEVHSHFWQRIPLLGRHLGQKHAEALQILLKSDQVVKTKYYVPDLKD